MDTTTRNGLTIGFEEEDLTITFDWDPETHPEYNWLETLTNERLCELLFNAINEENPNPSEV